MIFQAIFVLLLTIFVRAAPLQNSTGLITTTADLNSFTNVDKEFYSNDPYGNFSFPPMVDVVVNGSVEQHFPPGTVLSLEQWTKLTGQKNLDSLPKYNHETVVVTNSSGHNNTLTKRAVHCKDVGCSYTACLTEETVAQQIDYNRIYGSMHSLSSVLCGSGSISKTYTYSYSHSITITAGATLKATSVLEGLSFNFGVSYSYTWGYAKATGYTINCDANRACSLWFRPYIGVANAYAWVNKVKVASSGSGVQVCSSGAKTKYNIHIPFTDSDCSNSKDCTARGSFGSCYYSAAYAKSACSSKYTGPSSSEISCPTSFQT